MVRTFVPVRGYVGYGDILRSAHCGQHMLQLLHVSQMSIISIQTC